MACGTKSSTATKAAAETKKDSCGGCGSGCGGKK